MNTWATFYPWLRALHMGLALCSVALFVTRSLGVLAGAAWPLDRRWRVSSVLIDTALTAAGGVLWWGLGLSLLSQPWLAVKLGLIVVYIVLGSVALRRGRSTGGRALALIMALCCVAAVVLVARSHHPLGGLV